jgi:hypothetical protein
MAQVGLGKTSVKKRCEIIMVDIILTLEGRYFKRQYLLYIIEISHGNDKHYYIGQTGDHNVITARPAFRRLAGHLDDQGASTQNQVYRYLAFDVLKFTKPKGKSKKFDEKLKQAVEDYFVGSTIDMNIYILDPFIQGIDRDHHLKMVEKVTHFEKIVIDLFRKHQKKIANKKLSKPLKGKDCPYPEILKRIESDFQFT